MSTTSIAETTAAPLTLLTVDGASVDGATSILVWFVILELGGEKTWCNASRLIYQNSWQGERQEGVILNLGSVFYWIRIRFFVHVARGLARNP